MENRDRRYDPDIYSMRGIYTMQDIDFNLSQFGLFLTNDTVFMTVHINNSVDLLGRKIMPGDVFELPNLREEYIPDVTDINTIKNFAAAIKKYYVVEEINRAAEGFSATWYPHLYRIKLKPITASQEYADILNQPANTDTYAGAFDPDKTYYPGQTVMYNGQVYMVISAVGSAGTELSPPNPLAWVASTENTLGDLISNYNISLDVNAAVIAEAETDAPLSGYETSQYYTLAVDPFTGRSLLNTVDATVDNISDIDGFAGDVNAPPVRDGYKGYLLEDGAPPNGPLASDAQFGFGIQFPFGPVRGDTFLRTDYLPNRLFLWDGSRWVKQEDNVRMTMTNTNTRQTLKTSFINNPAVSGIDEAGGDTVIVGRAIDTNPDAGVTTELIIYPSSVVIVTRLDYNAKFIVEVWLNESSNATIRNGSDYAGKFGFTIPEAIANGVRIRYTVFSTYVTQRQAVSKALRKNEADL